MHTHLDALQVWEHSHNIIWTYQDMFCTARNLTLFQSWTSCGLTARKNKANAGNWWIGNALFRSVLGFVWSLNTVTGPFWRKPRSQTHISIWKDHSPFLWPDQAPSNVQHSYRNYRSQIQGPSLSSICKQLPLSDFVTFTGLPLRHPPVYNNTVSFNWRSQNFRESFLTHPHCGNAPW